MTCADGTINVSQIVWNTWTSSVAVGIGTLNMNNCSPDCANGSWTRAPTNVVLDKPADTAQGLLFTRLTVSGLASTQNGGGYSMRLPA
jgi:hypothetical protein